MTDHIPPGITDMEYKGLRELSEIVGQMIDSVERSKRLSPQYLKLVKRNIDATIDLFRED